jgi:hypothetical protein
MAQLDFLSVLTEQGPKLIKAFANVVEKNAIPGRIAQSLFRPSPMPDVKGVLDLHPEPVTASVLAEVARAPAGIYVCAEPSGCGKTSTFALAAAKVNGLKHILTSAFPAAADFDRMLLRHLGVDTAQAGVCLRFSLRTRHI